MQVCECAGCTVCKFTDLQVSRCVGKDRMFGSWRLTERGRGMEVVFGEKVWCGLDLSGEGLEVGSGGWWRRDER